MSESFEKFPKCRLRTVSAKLLLVVIDAATPHVVCPAVQTGQLPVMQKLAQAGAMHEASVSIFPSITPAATSTIITGCYPAEHGIAGASWYEAARDEIAYYGDDFWVIAREGFGKFVNDFLLRLNGDRLTAPTMFEMVERAGRRAASLNYLVYRGNVPHKVNIPGLLAALPGVPLTETVEGPSLLCLGDFVTPWTREGKVDKAGGLLHRFGMDDASTGKMLCDLVDEDGLGDFTVAYFADNDYVSHEVGPVKALPVVERVDRMLGEAFAAAGGMERFLEQRAIIITSDHGHCEVLRGREHIAPLHERLSDFPQAELGKPWRKRDAIMICPNMRAAQIYVREPTPDTIHKLCSELLREPVVDQVIWRSRLTGGTSGYTVASAEGMLEFAHDASAQACVDAFGGLWRWSGDPQVLGIRQAGRALEYSEYPNAFERIAGVLDLEQSGEIWVTARPGCEFEVPGGEAHEGGASHGALHMLDSHSPVIVAGAGAPATLPTNMRSVDIAPLCMQILGLTMRYTVGARRGS
jgi:hypothetical protein